MLKGNVEFKVLFSEICIENNICKNSEVAKVCVFFIFFKYF